MTVFETISIALMALAFLASIISLYISIKNAEKVNKLSQKTKYYDFIFKDNLMMKLPTLYLKYVEDSPYEPNITIVQEFQDFIEEFRKNILPLNFSDSNFYDKIDKLLVSIDDTVVRISGHKNEFLSLKEKLNNQIKDLYCTIDNYFIN